MEFVKTKAQMQLGRSKKEEPPPTAEEVLKAERRARVKEIMDRSLGVNAPQ